MGVIGSVFSCFGTGSGGAVAEVSLVQLVVSEETIVDDC